MEPVYKYSNVSNVNYLILSEPSVSDTAEEFAESCEESNESTSSSSTSSSLFSSDEEWEIVETKNCAELSGGWGNHGLNICSWPDEKRPMVKLRNCEEFLLNEYEVNGVLTDRIVAASSSYLDKSPLTDQYAYCKCNLSKKMLKDITILSCYHQLQYLDLSRNELTNLSPLEQLPFLMYLDVSYNNLEAVLDFKAPLNLTYVYHSHNHVTEIRDLSAFWSIKHLDLSNNRISQIKGLEKLRYLTHLNLSYNVISELENLNNMRIEELNLNHNNILTFEDGENVGLRTLNNLKVIHLNHNRITSLKLFENVENIESIDMRNNFVSNLLEIYHLQHLRFLINFNFIGNPVCTENYYLEVCFGVIKYLRILDDEIVDEQFKIDARKKFDEKFITNLPEMEQILLQQMAAPSIGMHVLPYDHPPPPIIILVGLPGSQKKDFIKAFCERYPKFAVLGISHTTRPKNYEEEEGKDYYFITSEDFIAMHRSGRFLSVAKFNGHSYGFAESELAKITEKRGVLIFHANMSAGIMLRTISLCAKLVLCLPASEETHIRWLRDKYYYYQSDNGIVKIENNPQKVEENRIFFRRFTELNNNLAVTELLNDIINAVVKEDMICDEILSTKENISVSGYSLSVSSAETAKSSSRSRILKHEEVHFSPSVTSKTDVPFEEMTTGDKNKTDKKKGVSFIEKGNSEDVIPEIEFRSVSQQMVNITEEQCLSVLSRCVFSRAQLLDTSEDEALIKEKMEQIDHARIEAQKFYKEIIDLRKEYFQIHWSTPGLFREVIFTDDPNSTNKLKRLVKFTVEHFKFVPPQTILEDDPAFQNIVESRLSFLHSDLERELSISEKQRYKCMPNCDNKLVTHSHCEGCIKMGECFKKL